MEELISGLVQKVGLSREKAEQVAEFLASNAEKVPQWLGKSDMVKEYAEKLPGGIGGMFGGGGDKK